MILPIATFINMAAVLIGGTLGLLLRGVFLEKIKLIMFQALGLVTLIIGLKMALEVQEPLIFIFSLVIGGIIWEGTNLEIVLNQSVERLKQRLKIKDEQFTEGLLTAFLLYCIGSMTIVGAIKEGIEGDMELLLIKSLLDGISGIALAVTYGSGVLFSVIPMLFFQGGLTISAAYAKPVFQDNPMMIPQLNAVGGALVLGIGINILELGKIKVTNLLPALILVVILTIGYDYFF